jgi:signal transduction histidine kinase
MSYYRSLLDDKEKFEYVLNHMNEGLLVLDPTLKVVRFNKKAQDLLGISLLSDHFEFSRYLKEAFRVHYSGDLIENMKGQVVNFDLERPETNDQKPLILLVRSSIVKNALNEVTSIVLLLNDVTEIRREEFKREMFLDFISHKMRTPLTVIKEYLGILKDDILGPLNDKQKEVVENSFEQSLIFKRMIEKLLGFSAISSRDVGKMREETELNSVLTNLLKSFSQEIGPQKIEYTLDFEKEKIKTDMGQDSIQLIMTNLIENAIEFNDHKPTHIKIGVKEVNAQIEISVSDDGRGIPSDIQEQIFEQFYQVDKFEAGNIQGLGMGLAIVKRLVTGYGGEIRVSSQVGKGSTFFFTVPPYVFLPKVGVERPVVNKPGRRRSMR